MRPIGALIGIAADDPDAQARYQAFVEALQKFGWTDGRNVRIDTRWAAGNAADARRYAAELVALTPDVILAVGSLSVGALLQATRTVPVVFTIVPDPIGAGFVDSLSRPGGNATGFLMYEYSLCGNGWNFSRRSRRLCVGIVSQPRNDAVLRVVAQRAAS